MSVDVEKQQPQADDTDQGQVVPEQQRQDESGNGGLLSTTLSQSTQQSSDSLDRVRSQNGYGVDDEQPSTSRVAPSYSQEKDPFEVGWDEGANDPLCPWGFKTARKWMIISILCAGSFTV